MKTNLLLAIVGAGLCAQAAAQNTVDDFPNLPPGAALVIGSNGTASMAGRINSATDVDVFNFMVASPSLLTVYTTGSTDTNGILRRPSITAAGTNGWGTVATEEGGTGNFRISRSVEPGQYSIQVGGKTVDGSANEYGLRVELTPATFPPADIDVPGAPMGSTQNIGTVEVGGTVRRTFTIGNTGGSPLNITGLTLLPDSPTLVALPFVIENGGARTVAAGGSTAFTVAFHPVLGGTWQAGVRINSSDTDENPWEFQFTGVGRVVTPPVAPEIAAAQGNAELPSGGTVDFGAVLVPGAADVVREVVIFNKGTADLTLGTVRLELLPLGSPIASAPDGFFKVLTQPAPVVAPGRSTVIRFGAGASAIPAVISPRFAVYAILENNDADENPYRLTLTATPVTPPPAGAPEIEVSSGDTALTDDGSLDMGTTPAGTVLRKSFVIRNTGDAALNVSAPMVTFSGPVIAIFPPPLLPFTVTSPGAVAVPPGGRYEFSVAFNSSAAGEFTAALNMGSNDADENPFTVILKATAEAGPPALLPEIGVSSEGADIAPGGVLDFGRTSLTVAVRRIIHVANTGTGPLNVRFAFQPVTRAANSATPMFFRFATAPFASVPAGSSKALTLAFQPMIAGAFETVLIISNNDADENPYRVRLTGTGGTDPARQPDIALSLGSANLPQGAPVDFGSANPGTSVTREIRIANTGTGDLRLGRITLSRPPVAVDAAGGANAAGVAPIPSPMPFRALPPPNGIVPAGGSATLRVVFMAPAFGTHQAVLSIESNDTDESPYKLNLSGTSNGSTPAPAEIGVSTGGADLPPGGDLDFGTVTIGVPVRRTVSIANTGTGELRISSFMILPVTNSAGFDAAGGFMPTVALVRVVSGVPAVAPGATGDFVLEMIGFAPGTAKLQARIGNNDADENPYGFTLSATVQAPVVDPPVVDPPVLVGPPVIAP